MKIRHKAVFRPESNTGILAPGWVAVGPYEDDRGLPVFHREDGPAVPSSHIPYRLADFRLW